MASYKIIHIDKYNVDVYVFMSWLLAKQMIIITYTWLYVKQMAQYYV